MKTVTKVGITFENCEYIVILAEHIRDMYMSDFESEIVHNGLSIWKKTYAKKIYLQFAPKANISIEFSGESLFNRVKLYDDITIIKVYYDDNTSEVYFVDWEDNGLGENKNQMSKIVGNDLCIGICENVEPFFNEMAGIE